MNLLRLKIVLAAIDYDDASLAALKAAHTLATAAGSRLHVVHVDAPGTADEEARSNTARTMIGRAGLSADDVQIHAMVGEPARVIRSLGDRIRADVIVLGPHRERGTGGPRLGSTALAVVTSSWAPCLVVARDMRLPLERVLVPVDLSDTSRGALMVGLSWACALRGGARHRAPAGKETVLLTALFVDRSAGVRDGEPRPKDSLEEELTRVRREAGTWAGVEIEGDVIARADVAPAVADYVREHRSDLVVLGTRGLGLDEVGRLGSVSAAVARHLETPVLLVPPAVWIDYAKRS